MALHWDQIPKKQGLYDPSMESDACGVGAVMDMNRKKSRKTLTDARDMAVRMTHRGAKQAHEDWIVRDDVLCACQKNIYGKIPAF